MQTPNFFSRITINWFSSVLVKGWRNPLQQGDLPPLPLELSSQACTTEFSKGLQKLPGQDEDLHPLLADRDVDNGDLSGGGGEAWSLEQRLRTPVTLLKLIWHLHGRALLRAAFLIHAWEGCILCLSPLIRAFINQLLECQNKPSAPASIFGLCFLIFLCPLVGSLCRTNCQRVMIQIQITLRSQLTCAVYKKCLRLGSDARNSMSSGRITNLMSTDVAKMCDVLYPMAAMISVAPAAIFICILLLYIQISWAAMVGLTVLLIVSPLTQWLIKRMQRHRGFMLGHSDMRVKLLSQFLAGVRVVKMYAWESAQKAEIESIRAKEVSSLLSCIWPRISMQSIMYSLPQFASIATFLVVGLTNPHAFDAANVFSCLVLFQIIRFPLNMLSNGLVDLGAAYTSASRLSAFFAYEEENVYVERPDKDGGDKDANGQLNPFTLVLKDIKDVERKCKEDKCVQVVSGGFGWTVSPREREAISRRLAVEESRMMKAASSTVGSSFSTAMVAASKGMKRYASGLMSQAKSFSDLLQYKMSMSRSTSLSCFKPDDGTSQGHRGAGSPSPLSSKLDDNFHEGSRLLNGAASAQHNHTSNANGVAGVQGGGETRAEDTGPELSTEPFKLSGIDLRVAPGELLCIVGKVGSGKSSLLSGLLGQMRHMGGTVHLGGSVAYVPQQAWIMNGTVVENVLMGLPMIEEKWQRVIHACALAHDLSLLPGGLSTEIGEKGVNLSGGQKQRLSLARALYQDCDIYMLDDPLSAVDVHVGSHIFHQCISGVLKSKTVLLVTNQVQYLPSAKRIMVLAEGQVLLQGNYQECLAEARFASMLEEFDSSVPAENGAKPKEEGQGVVGDAKSEGLRETERKSIEEVEEDAARRLGRDSSAGAGASAGVGGEEGGEEDKPLLSTSETHIQKSSEEKLAPEEEKPSENSTAAAEDKGRLTQKEDRELGQVGLRVYSTYAKAMGVPLIILALSIYSAEQAIRLGTNAWLAKWSEAEVANQEAEKLGEETDFSRNNYALGYGLFGVVYTVVVFARATSMNLGGYFACQVVQNRMVACLLRAPVSFFEATPVGRILNRVSRDQDEVDYNLPPLLMYMGNCFFRVLSTLLFLTIVQPPLLIMFVPLGVAYYFVQRYYRRSSIELQRLESISRSPVFANFSETLGGLDTIRAFQMNRMFIKRHEDKVNTNAQAYFMCKTAEEWISLRLDLISSAIVLSVCLLNVVFRHLISAGLVAMSLTESIDLTNFLNFAVKNAAQVESRFNCVERLLAYSHLPQEAPEELPPPAPQPSSQWPTSGMISFEDVWLKYRPELDPVLHGVSFKVNNGEKCGIVGRTGSGKSSIIVALFRIVEPFRGAIYLDGMNLMQMGLKYVREAVAAIPQEPVLFSGSLRSNLDPFNRFSDSDIWEALRLVAIKDYVRDVGGLDSSVSEGGDNFSVGQRQLLCVARALLRKPRVLVADEATASVDVETDAHIQRTIRTSFMSATVLTIAHRLNTIMDSDKVLVLDQGRVDEFGEIPTLMRRPEGSFRDIVTSAGLSPASAM